MLSKLVDRLRNPGFATWWAGFGALLLAVCIVLTIFGNSGTAGYDLANCKVAAEEPATEDGTKPVAGETTTGLKVVKVEPAKTTLNRDVCFVVEGVSPTTEEGETALYVLDGRALPAQSSTAAKPVLQTVTAKKVPGQQRLVVELEAPASATPELSSFWRDVARAAVVPDDTWGAGGTAWRVTVRHHPAGSDEGIYPGAALPARADDWCPGARCLRPVLREPGAHHEHPARQFPGRWPRRTRKPWRRAKGSRPTRRRPPRRRLRPTRRRRAPRGGWMRRSGELRLPGRRC